jgi:hypothetical protein
MGEGEEKPCLEVDLIGIEIEILGKNRMKFALISLSWRC